MFGEYVERTEHVELEGSNSMQKYKGTDCVPEYVSQAMIREI